MAGMFDPSQGFGGDSGLVAEQESITRRRQLLDAMEKQRMGHKYQGSLGQMLGQAAFNLGTAYVLNKNGEKLKDDTRAYDTRRQADLGQQIGAYMDLRNGKPGEVMDAAQVADLFQNDKAPQLADPVQADPRQAVIRAMASQHPELQAIGKLDLQAQLTGQKDKGFKDHTMPDGSIVRVRDDGSTQTLGNYAKKAAQWSDPYMVQGPDGKPLMVKRNLETNEVDVVDKAPKVTATASANARSITDRGELEFSKQLGKDMAGEFKSARETAKNAYKAKSFVGQMQQLEQAGIFSGPTANIATTLGAVGQALGLPVDEQKLANSQAFQQQFAAQVANVLTMGGGIGRSMTDADRKAFEQSLPTMLMSPQGRSRVYQMLNNQADQDIARAKSFQKQLHENPQYRDAAGMLTLNPVDESPSGLAGGVTPPGALPISPVGSKPRVSNW